MKSPAKPSFIVPIFLKDKAITNMERDLIVIISNLRDKDHIGMRTEKAVMDSYGKSKQLSRYLLFTEFCSSYVCGNSFSIICTPCVIFKLSYQS